MFDPQPPTKPATSLLKKAAVICSSLILGGIVIGLSCARGEDAAQEAEPLPSTKRGAVSVPVQTADERLLPGTKSSAPFTTGSLEFMVPPSAEADGGALEEPGALLPSTKVKVFDSSRPIRQVLEELATTQPQQLVTQSATRPTTQPSTRPSAQRP